jgi:hypothetical protein
MAKRWFKSQCLVSLPQSSRLLWEQYPLASGCPNYKGRNGAEVMHKNRVELMGFLGKDPESKSTKKTDARHPLDRHKNAVDAYGRATPRENRVASRHRYMESAMSVNLKAEICEHYERILLEPKLVHRYVPPGLWRLRTLQMHDPTRNPARTQVKRALCDFLNHESQIADRWIDEAAHQLVRTSD